MVEAADEANKLIRDLRDRNSELMIAMEEKDRRIKELEIVLRDSRKAVTRVEGANEAYLEVIEKLIDKI